MPWTAVRADGTYLQQRMVESGSFPLPFGQMFGARAKLGVMTVERGAMENVRQSESILRLLCHPQMAPLQSSVCFVTLMC